MRHDGFSLKDKQPLKVPLKTFEYSTICEINFHSHFKYVQFTMTHYNMNWLTMQINTHSLKETLQIANILLENCSCPNDYIFLNLYYENDELKTELIEGTFQELQDTLALQN